MEYIYLDHAATTPLRQEVVEAMLPYLTEHYGNPSSLHSIGRAARIAIDSSRDRMAALLGCKASEIIFTSGGTESDNLAILGAASIPKHHGGHLITSSIEHKAVLQACEELEHQGYDVTYLPVDRYGQVDIADVEKAIRADTFLISIMYGNNEIGTIQPIEAIGRMARERGILFHVDGVRALGTIPINLSELPVDMMSFSAHKINGPKGVGALYARTGLPVHPRQFGGSQEKKRRGGTENVAGIVGFARATELAITEKEQHVTHLRHLRTTMIEQLRAQVGEEYCAINGHPEQVLPHILNVSFPGVDTETMLMSLDLNGIAASSGSACTAGALEISHVLEAMKLPKSLMESAIRFSFGITTTEQNICTTVPKVATITNRIRK